MVNRICVYAICKNESPIVERWYNSMSEADAVVVLDTGSTDDTVEKLKKLGATVEQKIIDPWRFDVARNESMKMAPDDCNILVCADIDQVFEKGWANILREKWIDGYHRMCWYNFVFSHNADGSDDCFYRNNKIHCHGYKWYFPVHECLLIDEDHREELGELHDLDLFNEIKAHNYPIYSNSHIRYLPLLKLRVEENPDNFSGYHYLTQQYFYEGKYQECIDFGEKTLSLFSDIGDIYAANIYYFIGLSYKGLLDYKHALEYFYKGILKDKTYRENYLEIGEIYLYKSDKENKHEMAYNVLMSCLKDSFQHYSWLENEGSFGSKLYDMLSFSAFYSGHKKESLLYAFIASYRDKENERLKNNIDIIFNQLEEKDLS